MIDLHTHTTNSDGSLSTKELLDKAKQIGLKAIAITDHDTLSGLEYGINYSKTLGICFVPGVEIEIKHNYKGEFHLLGLGLKDLNGKLSKRLKDIQQYRKDRNLEIIRLMQNNNIDITMEQIEDIAGGDIVARPHFSSFLVQNGIAKNQNEAFKKFLSSGCPYFVEKESLELYEAIDLIHDSGGKAVIAHPQTLYISWNKLPSILKEYKEIGLDGIEAWHSGNNKKDCTKFEKIASDLRLIVTGGSDYHGSNINDRILGLGAGERNIPDILLENIL